MANKDNEIVLVQVYRKTRKRLKVEAAKKGVKMPDFIEQLV